MTLSARFPTRGVILGLGVTVVMMAAVAFGVDAQAVISRPPLLIMPLALTIAVAILSTALMKSDVIHRSEAVIDPLTGMLNRNSLKDRTFELAHQSERTGQPVGLIVGDIDHFKQVNDSFGHATGDAVLQDVAYLLRKQLRAFDLAYRIGGEEFLVLLPGADLEQSAAMAERLREGRAGRHGRGRAARDDELRRIGLRARPRLRLRGGLRAGRFARSTRPSAGVATWSAAACPPRRGRPLPDCGRDALTTDRGGGLGE